MTDGIHRKALVSLFDQLTGSRGLTPHPFQLDVTDHLLSRCNVILSAPTGSGKTWAALLPFIYCKIMKIPFFDRCIYTLPLRSLATMLFQDTVEACESYFGKGVVVTSTSGEGRSYAKSNNVYITIQTGEQQNDPFFEGDIVFTTIDQLLSSYFMMPVSQPGRLCNMNAGALPGALIVFDEFHLLEPGKSMDTALEMLNRITYFSCSMIMTATMSEKSTEWIAHFLKAKTVRLSAKEVNDLPCYVEKQRTYKWIPKALTAEQIWKCHNKGRSIALVNTVQRAQDLFHELKELSTWSDTDIILLHSRFYPDDRKEKEDLLSVFFGKNATKTDVILITTQVIEAGMDISADNLHTELAPMNSLIQRAGRCARYSNARGIGTVYIYELKKDDRGNTKWGPYSESTNRTLINATRSTLETLPANGSVIDFKTESEWINSVHAVDELRVLKSFDNNFFAHHRMVHEAMEGKRSNAIEKLIRNVFAVNLIITDRPENLCFNRKIWPRMLSVPRFSLYALSGLFEKKETAHWIAKVPVESAISDHDVFSWEWQEAENIQKLIYAPWLIVIHPKAACYSKCLGLRLAKGTEGETHIVYDHLAPRSNFIIRYETFIKHATKVMNKCEEVINRNLNTIKFIEEYFHMENGELKDILLMACALHDTGKLGKHWQEAMRAWQIHKDALKLSDEPLAHTDYDPNKDFQKQKEFPIRGNHAVEGAFAVSQYLLDLGISEDITATICTAIARHHAPHARNLSDFQLIDNAGEILDQIVPTFFKKKGCLQHRPDNLTLKEFGDSLLDFQRDEDNEDYGIWALYAFMVRILRLSDQKSF